ncbi:hypothetical protein EMCRGX_G008191 [Ephydatia muelleri]
MGLKEHILSHYCLDPCLLKIKETSGDTVSTPTKIAATKEKDVVDPSVAPNADQTRLALTLRFLASGDSQVSLSFSFRLGRSTVSTILSETCGVIWDVLVKEYVKAPSSVTMEED